MHAVHASRLERRLRHLASTLAFYASDDGGDIYPGIATLMAATGRDKRTIREGLQALVNSQLLIREGLQGHTRRYRFDLDRLAAYTPAQPTRLAWRQAHKGCATAHPSSLPRVRHGAPLQPDSEPAKGAPFSPQGCAAAPLRVRRFARTDSQYSQEQDLTGAAAPASSATAETEVDKPEERPVTDRHGSMSGAPDIETSNSLQVISIEAAPLAFKVYAAIASQAITNSLRDDQSDDLANITEHFKLLCAKQGKPYSAGIVQRAIDAAWTAREKEKHHFIETFRQRAGGKSL